VNLVARSVVVVEEVLEEKKGVTRRMGLPADLVSR
jgi:hypothetical protein